ncbi:MAG: NYN domain-containing protein [Bacteroidota bacterium]|nr:NYN domain-containing protein [Bacteroidota bacterium]
MQDTIYSAVFVDFDNIFLGLTRTKGAASAHSFASDPGGWLSWLTRYTGSEGDSDEKASSWLSWLSLNRSRTSPPDSVGVREIIVRRCYLNPTSFWRYRQPFAQAGFEVVDCPSLTQKNKSGADIRIVLDIMDLLQQRDPLINEFIIMSGDADFTPVVLRLRQRGRRIMVMMTRNAANAYLAAANAVIDSDEFESKALSDVPMPEPKAVPVQKPAEDHADKDLSAVDVLIKSELVESASPVRGAVVAQQIANRFDTSDWFGYGSFRSFIEVRLKPMGFKYAVQGTRDYIYDPTRHANPFRELSKPATRTNRSSSLLPRIDAFIADTVSESASGMVGGGKMAKLLQDRFGSGWYGYDSFKDFINARAAELGLEFHVAGSLNQVFDPNRYNPADGNGQGTDAGAQFEVAEVDRCITEALGRSETPILGVRMAQIIQGEFDTDDWFGYGKFKIFLTDRAQNLQLTYITTEDGRTWIFDPARHEDPRSKAVPHLLSEEKHSELVALVTPVAEASGLPLFSVAVYRKLFRIMAEEYKKDGYEYGRMVQSVSGRLNAELIPVTDFEVSWILDALEQVGFSFANPNQVTAGNLSFYYHYYVSEDVKARWGSLNEDQEELLRFWLRTG